MVIGKNECFNWLNNWMLLNGHISFVYIFSGDLYNTWQLKGINNKQSSTRWQHLSQLKANAFFSLQNFLVVMKHSNLYLGLVLPSGGWQSLIDKTCSIFAAKKVVKTNPEAILPLPTTNWQLVFCTPTTLSIMTFSMTINTSGHSAKWHLALCHSA